MFEQYRLKNKARVILVPQQDTKSVTVLVMYPVGSRYEPEHLNGVSHYIEHLMFKGTQKRKNTLVLTREIDRLGAEYNAFTNKETTGYYIKVDAAYTETALDILSDMLFHSKFDAKEMEREKGPIIEELRMYEDNPLMNIDTQFEKLLYHGSPLGWDIGGTPAHVRSFKRDEVLAFRDRYYHAGNATIIVAGHIDAQTKALIEKYVGSNTTHTSPVQKFPPAKFGSVAKKDRIVVKKKQTDQVQLMLGFPGLAARDARNPIASVLNTILGGSMSSRLFIQIRERRGLAYMVKSGSDNFHDTGYAYVRAGLEAKNINKAIGVIEQEIEKLISKGVTVRELADAKTHIHGALTLSLEDSSTQANWYAHEAMYLETMRRPDEWLNLIDRVSVKEIQAIAKKIFVAKQMRVAIIGEVESESVRF